jgi:glycosyltransferase involved in cell wall biosynthesis
MSERRAPPRDPQELLIVLSSLCAEGTPILTLELCRWWLRHGVRPVVATLNDQPRHLAPEFRSLGVELVPLALSRVSVLRFPSLWNAVFRLCKDRGFQSVLSMPLGWHAFTFSAARAAGARHTAVHVGNYPTDVGAPTFARFRFLTHLARPFTGTLICCSSHIQRGATELFGIPARETTLIYNGVDVEGIGARAAAARARARRDRFVVGTVATFEIHKDQPTLIRAVALLRQQGLPVELWLAGDGSRRDEYRGLIAELGLESDVKLLGVRRDIPELLGQMDLFVFAAKEDEGHPVALVEAMSAEVPILSTDARPCLEALGSNDTAAFVPMREPEAMARAIAAQLRDPRAPRWAERVARARLRALDQFSIGAMARAYSAHLGLHPSGDSPVGDSER